MKTTVLHSRLLAALLPVLLVLRCGTSSIDSLPKASAQQSITAGWQKYEIQEYLGAKLDFNDAVRLAPKIAEGYNGLGWTDFRLRLPVQAAFQFAAGIAVDTSNTQVYQDLLIGLAFAQYENDDLDGAIAAISSAIQVRPDQFDATGDEYLHDHDGMVSSREVRLLQAYILYYTDQLEESYNVVKQYLKPSITINPADPGFEGALLKELETL